MPIPMPKKTALDEKNSGEFVKRIVAGQCQFMGITTNQIYFMKKCNPSLISPDPALIKNTSFEVTILQNIPSF